MVLRGDGVMVKRKKEDYEEANTLLMQRERERERERESV